MAELINDTKVRLETFIKDSFPTVDIAPGTVISELLVKLAATLQNPVVNSIEALNQGNTIAEVLASDVDTYNPIIDSIGSNYNVSRGQGKKSVGQIKVVVTTNSSKILSSGFGFYQPVIKLNYVTARDYRATTDVVNDNDLQIIQEGELYYFIVPVEAEAVGSEYQVSNNSKFSLTLDGSLTDFVDAYAYGNFVSGLPVDSDKVLISKYQSGLTHKTLLTSSSLFARLQESFPSLRDISVVGANDEEMTRSKKNLFGLSTLGLADVYVRTTLGPETIQITKTATQTNGVWSFSLNYSDVPGFYRIVSILPSGKGLTGTLLNTPVFSYSTSGLSPSNLVNDAKEGRFSKYQTCNVTFEYASTETTADFDVLLAYQPNIGSIQDLLLFEKERIACADYLVKAALPCFVSTHLRVHRRNPNVDLPVEKIKQDIYNYINTISFGDNLYVSRLVDICHNYDVRYVEFPVKVTGEIYTNESKVISITSTDTLAIPTNLTAGVSPKTTAFFADYFKATAADNMSDSIGVEVI